MTMDFHSSVSRGINQDSVTSIDQQDPQYQIQFPLFSQLWLKLAHAPADIDPDLLSENRVIKAAYYCKRVMNIAK